MNGDDAVHVLGRREIERLLDLDDCIAAVERAFRVLGEGGAAAVRSLGLPVTGGGFHVKAGVLEGERPSVGAGPAAHAGAHANAGVHANAAAAVPLYFVAKVNGNFPGNPARHGLPTIQGVLVLADARDGRPLAVMDSGAITTLRTGAATAVAARRLARPDARVVTIVGCGVQGAVQLAALRRILPLERALAFDRDGCRADRFADAHPRHAGIEVTATGDLARALAQSDVVVTCTPARVAVLGPGDVRPGTFVAAVGADHPEKHEIAPRLMARCTVVVDDLEQCATMGDLHHALDAGAMTRADVHATLAELVAGRKPGRTRNDEVTLFDSTGIAIQDVAAAALAYERARANAVGVAAALAG